jgi:hypothetical protein
LRGGIPARSAQSELFTADFNPKEFESISADTLAIPAPPRICVKVHKLGNEKRKSTRSDISVDGEDK